SPSTSAEIMSKGITPSSRLIYATTPDVVKMTGRQAASGIRTGESRESRGLWPSRIGEPLALLSGVVEGSCARVDVIGGYCCNCCSQSRLIEHGGCDMLRRIARALSGFLGKEKQSLAAHPGAVIRDADTSIGINFARDDKIAALLRGATALRDAGDWSGAILNLQEAQRRSSTSAVDYRLTVDIRLALFLQGAGRFDESLAEIRRLLEAMPERVKQYRVHGEAAPVDWRNHFEAIDYREIYDALRKILKREKDPRLKNCEQVWRKWQARSVAYFRKLISREQVSIPRRPQPFIF
ncbi:MAG: hypothetical protein VB138_10660, partial [Burkholderia sp.]